MENDNNSKLRAIFSGIQKYSTVDDPGYLSATLFTNGCNMRCRYCHNSEFLTGKAPALDNEKVLKYLKSRIGLLDSIVICGGEPTIHKSLPNWIRKIKSMGFRIKLDTNGTNYNMVKELIDEGLIDLFAIDYKAPHAKYDQVTGIDPKYYNVLKTIELVANSGVDYDIRSTIHTDLLSKEDIFTMVEELKSVGVNKYAMQGYMHSDGVYDKTLKEDYSFQLISEIKEDVENSFDKLVLRNVQ